MERGEKIVVKKLFLYKKEDLPVIFNRMRNNAETALTCYTVGRYRVSQL